jgi:hypothetical protein
MEYDNNHFIIASRAYSLQSPTCTRVNNLVGTCVYNTYGFHVLSVRVAVVNLISRSDTFNSVCICISLRLYASLILK